MKSILWLVFGIAGGFVLAHFVQKTSWGGKLFADLDATITEMSGYVADEYRQQQDDSAVE